MANSKWASKINPVAFFACCILIALHFFIGASRCLSCDDDIERISRLWQQQDEELVNGRVKLILYRVAGLEVEFESFEAFCKECEQIGTAQSPEELEQFMENTWIPRINKHKPEFDKSHAVWGSSVEAVFDEGMYRIKWNESEGNAEFLKLPSYALTWNNQFNSIAIALTANHEYFDKNRLRLTPVEETKNGAILSLQKQDESSCVLTLSGEREIVADYGSGFIHRLTRKRGNDLDYFLQYQNNNHSLPNIGIRGVFSNNTLRTIFVRYVVSCETNTDLGSDAFVFKPPVDARIIDLRSGEEQATTSVALAGQDAIKVADLALEERNSKNSTKQDVEFDADGSNASNWWLPVLIFLSCVFLAIAFSIVKQKFFSVSEKGEQ